MQSVPPLFGAGSGTGILLWVVATTFSLVGVVATAAALWRSGDDGLRPHPGMVVLFPSVSVLVGVGCLAAVSGSFPGNIGAGSWVDRWVGTGLLPIGMGVIIGSGLYWRQWASVGGGLAVIIVGLLPVAGMPSHISLGLLVIYGLLPTISVGVGYLSSGSDGDPQERSPALSEHGTRIASSGDR